MTRKTVGDTMKSTRRSVAGARRLALAATAAIAAVLLLAACGSSSSSSSSSSSAGSGGLSKAAGNPNATLIVNNAVPIATLDPGLTTNDQDPGFDGAMYSTLTQVDQEAGKVAGTTQQNLGVSAVKPYVAKSYAFSNGNKTLTFQIRPGLKFPNGDPLDAKAVVWSIERDIKLEEGGYSVLEETDYTPPLIKSVKATGPLTVVFQYKRPAPNQLQVLSTPTAGAIYDPKLVEEHGGVKKATPNEWLASHSAGYGPYVIKSYQPNHQLVLEANPDFFEPPKTKKIILNMIPDNETLLLDAQSGAADITLGLTNQAAHSLVGNGCCTVASFKSRQAETLNFPQNARKPWLNDKDPFFKNQDFRQALTYAFPYEAVLQKVAYNYGKLYFGEWMPSYSWYDPKVGAPRETNLTKAKELLAKSGIKTPVSFTIYVGQGDNIGKEIATAAAGSWQPLGVNAKVQVVSPSAFLEVVYTNHDGASVFLDGPQVVAPDYHWAYDLQCPPNNQFNDTNTCVPAADKIMKEIPYVTQEPKRQELLNKADEMYIENSPRVWAYDTELVAVLGKNVTNYYSSDLPDMRFWAKG
ncbi:MAG TPA: ABC transporter substrate-binding protein [Solirubrobacteraceae bacterium]|nr:ABC transporter substrate-binding protein [Solirubrobacteraceae bacterium]